jgi:serine/threonine protein kinase
MDPSRTPANSVTQEAASGNAGQEVDLTGKTLGDFQIRRRVGQGGMGQVYVAEQISLRREVALKILRSDLAANRSALERFKAEATAVAKATHANIVQVYTISEAMVDNHLLHYIALEYIEGRNLREYLEKKGTVDTLVGLSIMRQVGSALQRASELGIIHRDIKPENILINRRGEVKVADFGLTYDPNRPVNLTQSGVTMGTPLYMAPEQVEARPIDPRTDIYSFGVTCFHMFAGHPPFKGNSPFEVALQHVQKEPPPLQDIRPDLPAELCALVHKMMAKKPEDRPQTSREIVRDVVRLRDTIVGVTNMGLSSSGQQLAAGAADSLPSVSRQSFFGVQRSTMGLRILGVLAILLALGGGLWWSYYRQVSIGNLPGPADDPGPVNTASSPDERERGLKNLFQEHNRPETRFIGGVHAIELGLFYLRDLRLDDADDFFQKITKEYPEVSKLGSAMVHAFRGEPEVSNPKFKEVLGERDKTFKKEKARDEMKIYWKTYHPWREMIGRALYHNKVNAPDSFLPELEVWLHPPRPNLKANPPMP